MSLSYIHICKGKYGNVQKIVDAEDARNFNLFSSLWKVSQYDKVVNQVETADLIVFIWVKRKILQR